MMKITKTLNEAIISGFFFSDPKLVYLGCSDEDMYNMYKTHEYKLLPDSQYIGIEEDGQLIAIVRYEFFTAYCVSMHMFMRSELHESKTKPGEAVQLLKTFITKDLGLNKVIIMAPSSCVHIHKFAVKMGFKQEGCISQCYKWRQKMVDLFIFGLTL